MRIAYFQVFTAVDTGDHTPLKQRFPEVVAAGICLASRMIQRSPETDFPSGRKPFRRILRIKRPVYTARLKGPVIQHHGGKGDPEPAEVAVLHFIGDNPPYLIVSLRRQGRMEGEAAGKNAQRQRKNHTRGEPPASPENQHRGNAADTRQNRIQNSRCTSSEKHTGNQRRGCRRKEPAPLTRSHMTRTLPASASAVSR